MIYVKTLLILNIFFYFRNKYIVNLFLFFFGFAVRKGKSLFCLGNYNNGITQPRLRRRQKLLLK